MKRLDKIDDVKFVKLRAQVKAGERLVEALERIASDNGRCINPCLCCRIAKQALNEYKKNR